MCFRSRPAPSRTFSLQSVGPPFPTSGDFPGPMTVDAYGKFLYVVNTGSNNLRGFVINASTGALTPFAGQNIATGVGPNSIAIRSDDSWLFVANTGYPGTLSQYALTISAGSLLSVPATGTFDYPSGVAVKWSIYQYPVPRPQTQPRAIPSRKIIAPAFFLGTWYWVLRVARVSQASWFTITCFRALIFFHSRRNA